MPSNWKSLPASVKSSCSASRRKRRWTVSYTHLDVYKRQALALALGSSVTLAADPDQAIRQSLKSLDANLPIEAIAESLSLIHI